MLFDLQVKGYKGLMALSNCGQIYAYAQTYAVYRRELVA